MATNQRAKNRTPQRSQSQWNFAEWRARFVVKAVLLPLASGCALLVIAYRLYYRSLYEPISLVGIGILTTAGLFLACISGLLLIATILTKGGRLLPTHVHGITDGLAALIALLVLVKGAPALAGRVFQDLNLARSQALTRIGVEQTFPVVRRVFRFQHGGHYDLYIAVPDRNGSIHELQSESTVSPETTARDSITIRYLPQNPEHFIEIR